MSTTHLETRRNKILEFTIQTYVETAQPVGSHEVCRRFHLRVSPATVRNVMGQLERDALLTHPHTSAGRVPTQRGYRYYVDLLMAPQRLSDPELRAVQALADEIGDDPWELLRQAARVLAVLSGQASMTFSLPMAEGIFRRLELIPMAPHRVLGILMTTDGLFKQVFLELQETVDAAEIARLSRFFNEELSGALLGGVSERLQQALMDATNALNYLYKRASDVWALGDFAGQEATLFVDGVSHVLMQPEFRDARQAHHLLQQLEHRETLARLLAETVRQGRSRIMIGSELGTSGMEHCSVVSAPYRVGTRVAGAVSVLGPARMDYPKVVHLVDEVAAILGRAMEHFAA